MTSFAFILGCVPLWTATGAGSVSRQIMGTTVIGGMLAASLIGIFLIPAIFYIVEKLSGAARRSGRRIRSRRTALAGARGFEPMKRSNLSHILVTAVLSRRAAPSVRTTRRPSVAVPPKFSRSRAPTRRRRPLRSRI